MSRLFRFAAVTAALLALGSAWPAMAGVPKMVFGEDFTATWCQYCPRADCALGIVDSTYGVQFDYLETHGPFQPPDPFVTSETTARMNRYGVTGYPTVNIDGSIQEVGADLCPIMVPIYSNDIDTRLNQTGGVSPIQITGEFSVVGNQATLTAHFTLLDAGTYTAHQATLYVYEDGVNCCTGYGGQHIWNRVVRMVRSSPLSLTTVGQVGTVTQTYDFTNVTPAVNPAHLHPFALYEEIGGAKTIIQASDFVPLDYSMDIPTRVASVPAGSGTAYFQGQVSNIGTVSDLIHLTIDNGFGWPAAFQVQGDPNWYQSYDLALGVGQSTGLTVRVQTDATHRIGTGHMNAVSQNTGRQTSIGLQVFNGSYAVLLVNDDNNTGYGTVFSNALTNLGYLYNTVTSAGPATMRGYDVVIWQTAYQSTTLTQTDEDALASYLDGGGKLFLSSMDFLTSVTMPNNFVTNYLGVASFTINTRASSAIGVGGDPITDGMNMVLNWPAPQANRVDTVNPGSGANAIFYSETNNPAAVRYQGAAFRTVFNTIAQNAFPTGGSDPNNSQYVIAKTINWLINGDATGVGPIAAAEPRLLLQAGPNPARGHEELRFSLGQSNAGVVRLSFADAGGRIVRTITSAPLQPGAQHAIWDCRDDAGHPVATGLYFAKLQTSNGSAATKVVVIH